MGFCCAPGCSSSSRKDEAVSFFSFPLDLKRRAEWMRRIPRNKWTANKHTKICSRHFEPHFIIKVDVIMSAEGKVIKT